MITNINNRLASWQANLLSQASKAILIISVLNSIPLYNLSITRINDSTIDKINKLIHNFFWNHNHGKGIKWISWKTLTTPLNSGGLGIKDIRCMRYAIQAKRFHSYINDSPDIWSNLVRAKYNKINPYSNHIQQNTSWSWKLFYKAAKKMHTNFIENINIGNMDIINEAWVFDTPISHKSTTISFGELDVATKVGDLIENNIRDKEHIKLIFDKHIAQRILNMDLPIFFHDDNWVWTKMVYCNATIRWAYDAIANSQDTSIIEAIIDWKTLWKMHASSRALLLCWRMILDDLNKLYGYRPW